MTDLIQRDPQSAAGSREEPAAVELAINIAPASHPPARPGLPADTIRSRVRGRSPSQIVWLKLRRNRTAMVGLYTLAVLYAAAIVAGFVAPYKYDDARGDLPFYPPMLRRIHIFDEQGHLRRPF